MTSVTEPDSAKPETVSVAGEQGDRPPLDLPPKVETEAKLKVPQRKISRFLVSPVLSGGLDVPKEKEVVAEQESDRKASEGK